MILISPRNENECPVFCGRAACRVFLFGEIHKGSEQLENNCNGTLRTSFGHYKNNACHEWLPREILTAGPRCPSIRSAFRQMNENAEWALRSRKTPPPVISLWTELLSDRRPVGWHGGWEFWVSTRGICGEWNDQRRCVASELKHLFFGLWRVFFSYFPFASLKTTKTDKRVDDSSHKDGTF